jgi:hypothetical protein
LWGQGAIPAKAASCKWALQDALWGARRHLLLPAALARHICRFAIMMLIERSWTGERGFDRAIAGPPRFVPE